jgi:hypothetical protein
VHWQARPSILVPTGQHSSILFAYGIGTAPDPTTGSPFNYDLLSAKYIGTDFGQGLNIPIAPAPASLAVLGLAAFMTRHPRRRHQ